MRKYNQLSEDIENKIVKNYLLGMSSVRLAKNFEINPSTVLAIVRRSGNIVRTLSESHRKYTFNENFFQTIDSEEKAYWLGFIVADGCICRNDLIIQLKAEDKPHLEKFVKSLNGDNQCQEVVSNGTRQFRLSIRSNKIFNDLIKLGLTPNKSLTAKVPKMRKDLLRHFWRGVIDGDGYVGRAKYDNIYFYLSFGLTGSESIIESFIEFINQKIKVKLKKSPDGNVWRVKTSCKNAYKICSLLYKDSVIYLCRKKNKYLEYENSHNI